MEEIMQADAHADDGRKLVFDSMCTGFPAPRQHGQSSLCLHLRRPLDKVMVPLHDTTSLGYGFNALSPLERLPQYPFFDFESKTSTINAFAVTNIHCLDSNNLHNRQQVQRTANRLCLRGC